MKKYILFILSVAAGYANSFAQPSPITIKPSSPTRHGPEQGSLLIIGGNVGSTTSVWNKFTELAGGKDNAKIVVVTTASGDSAAFDTKDVEEVKKQTGIRNITLLHTNDLQAANSEKFIAPLKEATIPSPTGPSRRSSTAAGSSQAARPAPPSRVPSSGVETQRARRYS